MNHLSLLQVLSFDERVIVASCADQMAIVTWNRSRTLQMWAIRGDGRFEECDIRTLSNDIKFEQASMVASKWLAE